MTDWNRHHGVGQTLLENWVEERAVGNRIVEERNTMERLQRAGHADILTHDGSRGVADVHTTTQEAFEARTYADPTRSSMGKRRQLLEAEIMRRALEDVKDPPLDRSARGWVSTTHHDFSSEVRVVDLGTRATTDTAASLRAGPITFWSDHATRGQGTTICSGLAEVGRTDVVGGDVKFGKHTDFSTPVVEYRKEPTKP
ncbi:Sperm-associated antigen 8 [Cladochytrium tenue]|nr:Sperm-associated antigen 8 [Cladochytrium tenue]